MAESLEWHVLHHRSARARWTLATCAGLVFGGIAAVLAASLVASGSLPRIWTSLGSLLAGVVAGAALGWYRGARERTPLADALVVDVAGVRWLPVTGVVAAVAAFTVQDLGPETIAQLALLGTALGAVGVVVVQTLRGAGRFDPETGTATVEGRVYDLERAPTTPIRLGGLTVVVVRRPAHDPLQRYGVLAMPTRVYGEVATVVAT